ncbi:MAG: hypothetical protein VW226_04365 [Rhodospirillaceae bacterium]|jgi:hypothetical protein
MDKVIALAAMISLITFIGIVLSFVVSLDLILICVLVLLLLAYDFWEQLFRSKDPK